MGKRTREVRPRRPALEPLEDRRLLTQPGTFLGKPLTDTLFQRLIVQLENNVPVAQRRLNYETAQGTQVLVTLYGFGSLAGSSLNPDGALNLVYGGTQSTTRIIVTTHGGTGFAPLASMRASGVMPGSASGAGSPEVGIVNLRAMDLVPGGFVNLAGGVGSLFLNSVGRDSQMHIVPLPPTSSTVPYPPLNVNGGGGNNVTGIVGSGAASSGVTNTSGLTTSGGGVAGNQIVVSTGLGSSAGGITTTTGITSSGISTGGGFAGGGGSFGQGGGGTAGLTTSGGSLAFSGTTGGANFGSTSGTAGGGLGTGGASVGTSPSTGGAVGTSSGSLIRLMSLAGAPAAQSAGALVPSVPGPAAGAPAARPARDARAAGTPAAQAAGGGTVRAAQTAVIGSTATSSTFATTPLNPNGNPVASGSNPPPIFGAALVPGGGNEFLFPLAGNNATTPTAPTGATIAIKHINAGPLNGAPPLGNPQFFGVDPESKTLIRFDGTSGAALQSIPIPSLTTANPSVGLGRVNGSQVAVVGDGQQVLVFDAMTGRALGQFSTANLAPFGFSGVDGVGSSDVGTLLVAHDGPAIPVNLSASLAQGMAVVSGGAFNPGREMILIGGATGVPGSDSIYSVIAAHFDTFQPDRLQFGIVTLAPIGHTYREVAIQPLTFAGGAGFIDAGTPDNLKSSPFQGLGSVDGQLTRLLGVVGTKNAVELIDPSTLAASGVVALDDPNPLSGLSESFHPEIDGAALIDVQGNINTFRAQDAHGLVLNDNGILNLVGINAATNSVIIGRPLLHANIPVRHNVQVVSDIRGPRGGATRGGIQIDTSLIRAPGPLTLPQTGPGVGNG